jgi:enolase
LGERSALQAAQDRRPGASGEPVAKYNRLIEIEADTNLAYGLR